MNRGPQPGVSRVDHVAKARAAWGETPDWVIALAELCSQIGNAAAGARVGYGASTISQVLSKTYRGDLGRIAESVSGALLGALVECPVLGTIGRDRCLQEQREPFRATSSMRAQLYHVCRSGCPNAHKGGDA
jgi:hypothetical protein